MPDIFFEAAKQKLRHEVDGQYLRTESLFSINEEKLDLYVRELHAQLTTNTHSFMVGVSNGADALTKLKFEVALQILTYRGEERVKAQEQQETAAKIKKQLELLDTAQNVALQEQYRNMSQEERDALIVSLKEQLKS